MAPHWFVARSRELARLNATLARRDTHEEMTFLVLEGVGGIGKTTLALHWAHRVAQQFPDGQLYTNLRGFDPAGTPINPNTVLHGFLGALGFDPPAVPADSEAAAALYRSILADRRILILLDNARDVDQVQPLLPGTRSCTVVVTTRHHLPELRMRGATVVRVDPLPPDDARSLLLKHIASSLLVGEQSNTW